MEPLFTWSVLGTLSGAAACTGMMTQVSKMLIPKLPTQILSYVYAVCILALATLFTTGFTLASACMVPINAVLVSLASNGAYVALKRTATAIKNKKK